MRKVERFMRERNLEVGDYVRIIEKENGNVSVYEGIVMNPYELSSGETLTLKLDNGYNIGILVDQIASVEILKKAAPRGRWSSRRSFRRGRTSRTSR